MPLNFLAIGIAIDKLDQNKMYYQLWIKSYICIMFKLLQRRITQYFALSVISSFKIAIKLIQSFDQVWEIKHKLLFFQPKMRHKNAYGLIKSSIKRFKMITNWNINFNMIISTFQWWTVYLRKQLQHCQGTHWQ